MGEKFIYVIAFSSILWNGHHRYSADALPFFECGENTVRLLQILSYVCNNTQPTVQFRDGCYGCFLRAASLPGGPPQLNAISQCALLYLSNSNYQTCSQQLATSLVGVRPDSTTQTFACGTGNCQFVRCIRRMNAMNLINTCFIENLVNRDFNRISDRIDFYTNTTACILAKTRCSEINPITADIQRQRGSNYPIGITNSVGTAGYYHHNALQIAPNGDIKIIGLPSSWVVGNAFCNQNISLDQSPYGNTCP